MNNETEQPVEATSSEEARSSIAGIAAKNEPKDTLNTLIRDLNNLVLVTISAVYYLDCFSILFLLRFLSQNQSTTGGIRVVLTSNLVCILTHIFHSLPQPAPREFWNHGGALVDFVGEKPTSRAKLIILDILIVSLQILHLALYYKKATVDDSSKTKAPPPAQDLEAEEAGISRANAPTQVETEEGIEMQSLLPPDSETGTGQGQAPQADTTIIILRKADFKEVFFNTARNTDSEQSAAAVRGFIDRFNAVRARRAALQTAGNTTAT
ncbi:hypothetical protein PMZ80_006642 [Knufia obscura]|uniref:DUF1746 domain-containing protein n=2 Tax=Knufia TaxID=430999 RepID=A0AAN8EP46_9EURO|nr:hypothetical protein PMZ80_006642 [Knufia obscura]KAK5951001.1 hypothetical protein OHC33_008073 [Knufia fluminis]